MSINHSSAEGRDEHHIPREFRFVIKEYFYRDKNREGRRRYYRLTGIVESNAFRAGYNMIEISAHAITDYQRRLGHHGYRVGYFSSHIAPGAREGEEMQGCSFQKLTDRLGDPRATALAQSLRERLIFLSTLATGGRL